MVTDSDALVVPPLIVLGFFALIVGANVLIVRFSGWYALSKAYPCSSNALPANRRRFVSAKIGWLKYNMALVVGVDPAGLSISALPLLDFMSPAISIPWSALHLEHRSTFLWMVTLRLRADTGTKIEFYGETARMVGSAMDIARANGAHESCL